MKSEEILKRQAAEDDEMITLGQRWPWLVTGLEAEYVIVTLFEGVIKEEGTIITGEGFENPLLDTLK